MENCLQQYGTKKRLQQYMMTQADSRFVMQQLRRHSMALFVYV